MLAFSIMMWFSSAVICFFSICILRGDASPMHGKKDYEILAEDKEEYAKSVGKICLFMAAGLFLSGAVALAGTAEQGVLYALAVIIVIMAASGCCYYKVIHKYRKKE